MLRIFLFASLLYGFALSAADHQKAEDEVRAFLKKYRAAFKQRDESVLRGFYVTDGRFAFYEDGQLRYQSVDKILKTLQGMPATMDWESTYTDTQVHLLGKRHASVRTKFNSKIISNGKAVYGWAGVTTMILEKDKSGWKILSAHSSTPKPRSAQASSKSKR